MNIKKIAVGAFGIYLILDGVLSILWQQNDGCLNNTPMGNVVRIVRALIGLTLITMALRSD